MKRKWLLLILLCISGVFTTKVVIAFDGNAQVIQAEDFGDCHDIIINDGVSDEYFDSVLEYWDMIPIDIRASMKADGWTATATFKDLNHIKTPNSIEGNLTGGYVDWDNDNLVIADRIASNILHEVGHYWDYKQKFCSSDMPDEVHQSEMENAMKVDSSRTATIGNYSTKIEYYAACFELYLLKPDELKEMCPETYAFIEDHITLGE